MLGSVLPDLGTGLTDNADEAVLGYRAGRPAVNNLGVEPLANAPVIDVIAVEERDQNVDVQQSACPTASSSRNLSTSAFDIAGPRWPNGSKP